MTVGGFILLLLSAFVLLGTAGCGTFSGMSADERDQANRDLARESQFWPAFKPDRSLHDPNWVP